VALTTLKGFRLLYLAGGTPLILLLTVGVESTVLMAKYPKAALEFYGRFYGLGWAWILMVAGAGLLVFAAALRPAAGDPSPVPLAASTTRRA
jgi:hypothetical protein